jgi:hypothetical protein
VNKVARMEKRDRADKLCCPMVGGKSGTIVFICNHLPRTYPSFLTDNPQ